MRKSLLYFLADGHQNAIKVDAQIPKAYYDNSNILIVGVQGVLCPEVYDQLQDLAEYARGAKAIEGIALLIDSPGGTVMGLFEACAALKEIGKPMMAFSSGLMASAAYAIASCADQIYAAPSAEVGSVGARILHVDVSKALNEFGIKVTEVGFGKRKTQFSPFHSLSDDDKKELESYVRESYDEFCLHVRDRRSKVKEDVFDSGLYHGGKAIDMGLIDGTLGSNKKFVEFAKKVLHK